MNPTRARVAHDCSAGSIAGTMTFPQVVQRLVEIDAESYHADLHRREKTYYFPDGDSVVEPEVALRPDEFGADRIAADFSAEAVKAALAAVQSARIDYLEFLRRIMAAGTVGYTVHIRGKRVIYVGRTGDFHIEWFPGAR